MTPTPANHRDEDAFHPRDAIAQVTGIYRRHRLLVWVTAALTVLLVVLYVYLFPPVYSATARIQVEPDKDVPRDTFYDRWNIFRKEDTQSEIELVTAGPVLVEVIDELNLKYTDVAHPPLNWLAYLWRESAVGKLYRSVKEKIFPPETSPWDLTPEKKEKAMVLSDLRATVSVGAVKDTRIGELKVKGSTRRVFEIANAIVKTYLKHRTARHKAEAATANRALTAQLASAKKELLDLEEKQQRYYEENGIYFDFAKEKSDVEQWSKIGLAVEESKARLQNIEDRLATIRRHLAQESEDRVSSRTLQINAMKETMRGQLASLELIRTDSLHRFQADSPEVIEVEDSIRQLKSRIDREADMVPAQETKSLNSVYDSLRQQMIALMAEQSGEKAAQDSLRKSESVYSDALNQWASKARGANSLHREKFLAEQKYNLILEKQTIAAISEVSSDLAEPSLRIVELATVPDTADWPKTRVLVIAAIIVGLALGLGAAWLRELFTSESPGSRSGAVS
jgi:uncharacterized protein involved in exopolysaccharide biosynthesis